MGMNLNIKARWADALRGGDFKQGQGTLKNKSDLHCCLGVLCELHRLAQQGGEWVSLDDGGKVFSYDGQHSVPSRSVREWAGLEGYSPPVHLSDDSLANMNDRGMTFAEIADIIEEKL